MDIEQYLQEKRKLIDEALDKFLPADNQLPIIYESMRYSVFAGGKRLRPVLFLATAELFREDLEGILPVACAIELIHTYSLIHDDLPAMDDDDLRRGMPTNHKVYGEGFAILTGDALLTYAFELIAQTAEKEDKSLVLRSLVEIARAAGTEGMIGGQTLDLFFEGKKIDSQTIKDIHRRKTGALITVSARTGAILGRASEKELALVTGYARALGLAFQIVDDLLDLTGDEQKLGKRVGTDRERGKATFPAIYSEEECRKMVVDLYTEALEYLVPFKQRGEMLKKLADKLVFRES